MLRRFYVFFVEMAHPGMVAGGRTPLGIPVLSPVADRRGPLCRGGGSCRFYGAGFSNVACARLRFFLFRYSGKAQETVK